MTIKIEQSIITLDTKMNIKSGSYKGGNMRNQISLKIMDATVKAVDEIAKTNQLTRNNCIEIATTLSVLNINKDKLTDSDIDNIWSKIITKSNCTARKEFKDLHKNLSREVKIEILKLFYNINMMENIRYSAMKQVNFYKGEEYLFYYAILDMYNKDIDEYINNIGIDVEILGEPNDDSSKYIYLGKRRYFTRKDQESKVFDTICKKLKINSCECIKLHYKNLDKLLQIIDEI